MLKESVYPVTREIPQVLISIAARESWDLYNRQPFMKCSVHTKLLSTLNSMRWDNLQPVLVHVGRQRWTLRGGILIWWFKPAEQPFLEIYPSIPDTLAFWPCPAPRTHAWEPTFPIHSIVVQGCNCLQGREIYHPDYVYLFWYVRLPLTAACPTLSSYVLPGCSRWMMAFTIS